MAPKELGHLLVTDEFPSLGLGQTLIDGGDRFFVQLFWALVLRSQSKQYIGSEILLLVRELPYLFKGLFKRPSHDMSLSLSPLCCMLAGCRNQ
jgi:hypothetical protein